MYKIATLFTCCLLFPSISFAHMEMDVRRENHKLSEEIETLKGTIQKLEKQVKTYKNRATRTNVELRKIKQLCDRNNLDYSNLDDVRVETRTLFDVVKDNIKEKLGKSNRADVKRVWGISRGVSKNHKTFIYVKWSENTGTSVKSDIEHIIFSILAEDKLKYDAIIMQYTSSHTDNFGNIRELYGTLNIIYSSNIKKINWANFPRGNIHNFVNPLKEDYDLTRLNQQFRHSKKRR